MYFEFDIQNAFDNKYALKRKSEICSENVFFIVCVHLSKSF